MKYKKRFIPFLIFALLLISPFIFYALSPEAFVIYFFVILTYWLYRSFAFTVLSFVGYFYFRFSPHIEVAPFDRPRMTQRLQSGDSHSSKLKPYTLNLKPNSPYHLIPIAVYNEELKIIQESLDSIINQNYEKDKILISISIEEKRSTSSAVKLKKKLEELYKNKIQISICIHPFGLENEVPGAGSNKAFAEKNGVMMVDEKKISIDAVIVTIPDADTVFSENYLETLAYLWITDERRDNKFFQTNSYMFDRSYLESNIFTRILSSGLTLSILSSSFLRSKARYTFSCFSLSLYTLIKCGFTDATIPVDDTTFHMRAIEKLNGDFECCLVNSKIYVRPTFGKNYFDSLNEQYKQYKRWGWGVIAFISLLSTLRNNPNISFLRKINLFLTAFEVFFVNKVIPILVFISLYLLKLNSEILDSETLDWIAFVLILNTLTLIPTVITKFLVIPKPWEIARRDKPWFVPTLRFILNLIIEIPISAITLFTFGFIPYIHASLEFMISPLGYSKIEWSKKSVTQE